MRRTFRPRAFVVAPAVAQLAAGAPMNRGEWRHFSPILSSQVRSLAQLSQLAAYCAAKPFIFSGGLPKVCTTF